MVLRGKLLTPVVLACATLPAACGGGVTAPGSASGAPKGNFITQAFRFSACMRGHGVPNFPEPHVVHHNGETGVAIAAKPVAGHSAQMAAALKACAGIMPRPQNESPAQVAAQRRAHLRGGLGFARCMRSHGVASFPDPTSTGELTLEMVQGAGIDLHVPAVQRAAFACASSSHGQLTPGKIRQALSQAGAG